jgi:hypothetical protein
MQSLTRLKLFVLFGFLITLLMNSSAVLAQNNIPFESLTIFPSVLNDKYSYSIGSNIDPLTGAITSTLTVRSNDTEIEKDHFYGAVLKPDPTPYIGSTVRLSVDVLINKIYPNRAYTGTGAHLYLKQNRDTRPGEKVKDNFESCMLFFDNSDNRYYTTEDHDGYSPYFTEYRKTSHRFLVRGRWRRYFF